ncbi:hypothetical protein RA264_28550, partial [Pseudomonas syringae pv. tagetis]|uniref:hypothetical protein n=1 Tax=Pseudomonas syringae group genomosp. 7 TaxID=251699 RepID=UPI00376F5175
GLHVCELVAGQESAFVWAVRNALCCGFFYGYLLVGHVRGVFVVMLNVEGSDLLLEQSMTEV